MVRLTQVDRQAVRPGINLEDRGVVGAPVIASILLETDRGDLVFVD